MLLVFVIFTFYIMHIHFLLQYIIWDIAGADFFIYYVPYRYSREVALETLLFCVSCAVVFVVGYYLSKRAFLTRLPRSQEKLKNENHFEKSIRFANLFLAIQISLGLYALAVNGLNYAAIFHFKMSMNFLYESRMVALLLLSYVLLNTPPKEWLSNKKYRLTAVLFSLYFVLSVLMQSRSVIFECAAVVGFCWLMWQGNRVKIKYLAVCLCAVFIPNLIAIPRFGGELDWQTMIDGIFSFEYAVSINNILSSAIANKEPPYLMDIFVSIPSLLIPSPVRNLFGIGITPGRGGDYYWFIIQDANVLGGGFSLLAEMYMKLGWWGGISMFALMGLLIGKLVRGALNVGRVELLYASAPLIYSSFIIAFRNDFTTLAKYAIQLLLIAVIMNYFLRFSIRRRVGYCNIHTAVKRRS